MTEEQKRQKKEGYYRQRPFDVVDVDVDDEMCLFSSMSPGISKMRKKQNSLETNIDSEGKKA